MTLDMLLPLIMRWIHILSAIVAVGGAFFMYYVLRPSAAAVLPESLGMSLREAITTRWRRIVHTAIALFLISGLYNYLVVMVPQHREQPLYHMLFGIKFLLALAVFALAIALTSTKAWSMRFRESSRGWLGWLVTLAIGVVLISGILRALPRTDPGEPVDTVVIEEVEG